METTKNEQQAESISSCCKNAKCHHTWKILLFTLLGISILLNIFTLTRGNFTMDTPWEKRDMMRNSMMEKRYEKDASDKTSSQMDHGEMDMSDPMSMSMRDMGAMLEGQTGDDLDRAFLEGMIPHHQGAVDMAKYLVNAKHPELQKMGKDIITAQQTEIDQMKKWIIDWKYDVQISTKGPNSLSSGSTNSGLVTIPVGPTSMAEHCKTMPEMAGCERFK